MLISSTDIDLGTVQLGSSNITTVTLTAETEALAITSIAVGCGSCTTVAADSKTADSGEAIVLTITFRPTSKGSQKKKVTLKTVEGTTHTTTAININANVI